MTFADTPLGASTSHVPTLAELQAPVAEDLDRVLAEIRRIIQSNFGMIEELNQYLMLLQGKLFRPALLLLSSRIGGRPSERAPTLGAVIELLHLATLIHDDAVDHSVLRRGMPTVHALWNHQVAIIIGDYLYSRAVVELGAAEDIQSIQVLGAAANEMSVGEMRQLTSYDALEFTEEDYTRLIAAKTASLMSAACEMGALAGVPEYREPLGRFGHHLGMAFQVADDLLDYTGSEEVTGKPTGHDLRERKVTLPLVGALPRASQAQEARIREFFTLAEPNDDEIGEIIAVVTELGGLEYARERAQTYARKALEALDGLPGGDAMDSLRGSVAYAIERRR